MMTHPWDYLRPHILRGLTNELERRGWRATFEYPGFIAIRASGRDFVIGIDGDADAQRLMLQESHDDGARSTHHADLTVIRLPYDLTPLTADIEAAINALTATQEK